MRLPPNRLFPWLPLLLFACFPPALAAQSWTTVWTPGGAPTIQATGGGGTHDSKTNCYPCKEWEEYPDGGGKWVKYPTNTPPQICPGDTTNYICKMCDGMGEVTNRPNNTPVDAGDGCGCCKDGQPWAPDEDCMNPMSVIFDFVRLGDCPCTGHELGCVDPGSYIVHPDATACYEKCIWKPAPEDFTIFYLSGTCPNNCQSSIGSISDVNSNNFCAVINALAERIKKDKQYSINPPPPPNPFSPQKPPEPICFSQCIADHENEHILQYKELWNDYEDKIRTALSAISVDFNCTTARTPSDAGKLLANQMSAALATISSELGQEWANDIQDNEKKAYQVSHKCLEDLQNEIHALAAVNGWTCP